MTEAVHRGLKKRLAAAAAVCLGVSTLVLVAAKYLAGYASIQPGMMLPFLVLSIGAVTFYSRR